MLTAADVTHIFASEYARTQGTVSYLAKFANKEVKVISAGKMDEQLNALRELPAGSVAVVCGHSNTVPGMVMKLGGKIKNLVEHPKYGPMLDSKEFSRLFMVTIPGVKGSTAKTVELRY
jgi:phosphohistidine phosphatase SixA